MSKAYGFHIFTNDTIISGLKWGGILKYLLYILQPKPAVYIPLKIVCFICAWGRERESC